MMKDNNKKLKLQLTIPAQMYKLKLKRKSDNKSLKLCRINDLQWT